MPFTPATRLPQYGVIDLLRFLAAVSVVLYHLTFRGYAADHLSPVAYPALAPFTKYGYLGVELFFIISGFLILMSAQGKTVKRFLSSRVSRLYPAFWVACTLTFLVVRLLGPRPGTLGWSHWIDASVKEYLANLTMMAPFFGQQLLDGPYWTLVYELKFYFIIILLLALGGLAEKRLLLLLWGWLALSLILPEEGEFAMLLFPDYAPYFIAGMLFYLVAKNGPAYRFLLPLSVAYGSSLLCSRQTMLHYRSFYHQGFQLWVGYVTVTVFFVLFLLIALNRLRVKRGAAVIWLGALTYPLYLLHHNIGYVLLQRLAGHFSASTLLAGILLLTFLCAALLHLVVERPFARPLSKVVGWAFDKL
jgi:peptidoglycan/LPS O-acetylase OafA/YrhL